MSDYTPPEQQAARQLTEYLTKDVGYGKPSPIMAMVQAEISVLARKIAAEVVAENPALAEQIRSLTARVVALALSKDEYITKPVIQAVSEALAVRVRELEGFGDE